MSFPKRRDKPRRGKPKRANKLSPRDSQPLEVEIEFLGGKGDGVAKSNDKTYFVPFSVPGDRLLIKPETKRGEGFASSIVEIKEAGPHRFEAPCPHYSTCGGCSLQHLEPSFYGDWKRQLVVDAFSRRGLHPEILPVKSAAIGQRRRVSFEVIRAGGRLVFGFNARQSHQVVPIDHCLLLVPEINQLIPALEKLIPHLTDAGERGDVVINFVNGLLDIVFALPGDLSLDRLEKLSAFADKHDIGRISWNRHKGGTPESVVQRKPIKALFGDVPVEIPAGSFLQPSEDGEGLLVNEVHKGIGDCSKIADLFSGCGTFSFPMAKTALIHAFEASQVMISAMEQAAGRAGLGGNITGNVRDLERQPLSVKELKEYDGVVFDPPRAGAQEQAQVLSESTISTVVGVSCNPNTFARDARLLVDGGFEIKRVIPVDQFPYSPHMEAVAIFCRK
ncbi:MAG: 23S rRNA (uracil(1939)-C(5))-methyltransferase RlmD [Alphaproteobacteria bacterium]|nr:23S rRNA (uracil(1939)-C(5))-methyltransferase RlmD [Alphaproteobacteria bacterium]